MAGSGMLLFLLGAAAGSFLNVLSMRYEPERRIFSAGGKPASGWDFGGRSRCPHCKKTLQWFELIPLISFILQKGRCRSCGAKLSFQYPFVETLCGLIFVFLPSAVNDAYRLSFYRAAGAMPFWSYLLSAFFLLAVLTLILISIIDSRLTIIPDQSNILIAFLAIIIIFIESGYGLFDEQAGSFLGHYAILLGLRHNVWINHLFAAFFGLASFGLIVILSRGRGMGLGDVKLAGALGLLLGWPDILLTILLAFITGAIWSIILMARGKKGFKSTVPFGPFIGLGSTLVMLFGKQIVLGYFLLFP